MKIVLQRVKRAEVRVDGQSVGCIHSGLLLFIGVGKEDTQKEADYLVDKITQLRVFEDGKGKMNLSALEINAQMLVVSQFTIYGDCRKGRRPSFDKAADPGKGKELYEYFVQALRGKGIDVATGQFQAMMDVELVNDGPVTFILES